MNVLVSYCLSPDPQSFHRNLLEVQHFYSLRRVPAEQVEKNISGTAQSRGLKERCSYSCVHTVGPTSVKLDHPPRDAVTSKGKGAVESHQP